MIQTISQITEINENIDNMQSRMKTTEFFPIRYRCHLYTFWLILCYNDPWRMQRSSPAKIARRLWNAATIVMVWFALPAMFADRFSLLGWILLRHTMHLKFSAVYVAEPTWNAFFKQVNNSVQQSFVEITDRLFKKAMPIHFVNYFTTNNILWI